MRLTGLALGLALAIVLALGAVSSVGGQGVDIRISELQCTGDPEVVVIENAGETAQTLTGWELQSDPPDSEVFDLGALGGLQPGTSVFIQSGPSASGVFNWGMEFIFRDDDATDYARIVDDTGTVVDQVDCGGDVAPQPTSTPTPTASPQASPTPSPTPEPSPGPGDVPNGGGPPPPSGDTLLAALLLLVGGGMAAAGVATGAFAGLRLLSSPVAGTAATPAPRETGSHRQGPAALGLALAGLVAAALVLRRLQRR